MQNRNFWTEELLRWTRQKKSISEIKQAFTGQKTISEDSDTGQSTELETIAETGMIEEYNILEEMGRGADAAVYKAEKQGQAYIIKVPLTNKEAKKRLKNEMDISIKIGWLTKKTMQKGWRQAPHIIHMLDCRKGNLTFAVLEMLEKQIQRTHKRSGKTRFYTLAALEAAASEGQHSTRVALYAWDTLHALEFMHSMDMVHRDVKYQNSMATHRKGKLASVLFDLGTALDLTDEKSVRTAHFTGTAAYLPKDTVTNVWRHNKNGGFYESCPMNRLKLVLKKGDFGALAYSIAHLLTGTPAYSAVNETGETTNLFDSCDTNLQQVNAILNYEGNPINYDRIREQVHGEMFAAVIEKLLDPLICSRKELDHVRETLEKGMKMEGLLTRYREK
jgi:serine/threonine protein kinase